MKLKIQILHRAAVVPTYAHAGDAGFDLYTPESATVRPGDAAQIATGIALELPEGYVGLIWDKSGLSHKHGLKTLGGVVDSGYRGEVKVGMINLGKTSYTFAAGDKVAQMLIQKVERADIEVVDTLSDTARADGGFGSTGK